MHCIVSAFNMMFCIVLVEVNKLPVVATSDNTLQIFVLPAYKMWCYRAHCHFVSSFFVLPAMHSPEFSDVDEENMEKLSLCGFKQSCVSPASHC